MCHRRLWCLIVDLTQVPVWFTQVMSAAGTHSAVRFLGIASESRPPMIAPSYFNLGAVQTLYEFLTGMGVPVRFFSRTPSCCQLRQSSCCLFVLRSLGSVF